VKARKRYYVLRLGTLLGTMALGTLAGYFVGSAAIRHVMNTRLAGFAAQLEQHQEEVAGEITSTLRAANASTAIPCSSEDITLLRRLTFVARFLKDVGRIKNKELACSATIGKLTQPKPLQKPDITGPAGSVIYRSYPLYQPAGDRADIVVARNADVVINPEVFSEYPQSPIHYAVGITDAASGMLLSSRGSMAFPKELLQSPHRTTKGDTVFVGRFSPKLPMGAITFISISEMWAVNKALLAGYTGTGTLAGLACGTALLLVGRKRSSHSHQLRRAVLVGNLAVAYQPIVQLRTHKIVGAEALARWTDEDGDSIRPEIIVALAEAEGFVSELTRFVVTRALEELRPLFQSDPGFRVSINLAPSDLADPRLLMLLDEKMQDEVITPANIAFELPERATTDREIAISSIRRLRERGHAIFIDEFGTGYSNLTYLSELNVDGIKINRSFIATIGTESVTASIVPQILKVAEVLSLSVVVQGIEREEQVLYFSNGDPKILGQGWFLGLPVSARNLRYLCAEKSE
jgi:sensor c-di-GMP phosphodiesterase-like protein